MTSLAALLLSTTVASAQGDDESPAPVDTSEAETLPTVDEDQLARLEPQRGALPQNPYGWRPWAAYALEWGEARIGVGEVAVGILPRTELGTSVPLDALGVGNARAKVDVLRLGPVDLAAEGSYHALPRTDFSMSWVQAGGLVSIRVAEPITLHLGSRWGRIDAQGLPELGGLAGAFTGGQTDELEDWVTTARAEGVELAVQRTAVSSRVALDWRFNRRDSIVLQASGVPWASGARTTEGLDDAPDEVAEETEETLSGLPPILLLDDLLDSGDTVGERLSSSYMASLAYQASFKNATFRVGIGTSAIPWAWLIQSTELAFHFGGKTRGEERRMRRGWRDNREDVRDSGGGDPDAR